jgi:hypothetical protein
VWISDRQDGATREEEAQAEDQPDTVHFEYWPWVSQSIERLCATCGRNARSDVTRPIASTAIVECYGFRQLAHCATLVGCNYHASSCGTANTNRGEDTQDQAVYQQEPAIHSNFRDATII